MVKFTSSLFVIASIAVSAFASPLLLRDISKVKADLQDASRAVINLDAAVSMLGNAVTVPQAMAVNMKVEAVEKTIEQTTKDVMGVHDVSESDAKEILNGAERLTPTILHLLNNLGKKKSAFASLPIQAIPIIKHELQVMREHSSTLGKAMIDVAPNHMKAEATKTKNTIDDAFSKTINMYA